MTQEEKKWFWYRFFRKDLELNKKRWHRLLKVIFWLLIFVIIIDAFVSILNGTGGHFKVYKAIEPLENRFTDKLVNLPDLLNEWENVFYDNVYWFPLFYTWFIWKGKYETISDEQIKNFNDFYWWLDKDLSAYYCSTKLADNFSELKKITGMKDVRAYEWAYDVVWWNIDNDIDKIKKYINENYIKQYTKVDNINCIAAKKYPDFECLDFTRWSIHDLYIFKYSSLLTRITIISEFIAEVILLAVVALALVTIYYKLIIYIIYWNYKKGKQ